MHYIGVPKLWNIHSIPLDPKWYLGVFLSIMLTFGTYKMQNLYSSLNALFRGTEVVKHPFYSIGPKMMFGSVSEHFANIRHVKDAKLVFLAWMHYFGVPKLWSIDPTPLDPKWCLGAFWSILLTFGTYNMQNLCSSLMHYFGVSKLQSIHSTPLDPKWCLGVFQSISLTFGT
jgi:hypothetical protein